MKILIQLENDDQIYEATSADPGVIYLESGDHTFELTQDEYIAALKNELKWAVGRRTNA